MSGRRMSGADWVRTLDAAMRSDHPEADLHDLEAILREAGQTYDATMAAAVRLLLRLREIELLMRIRAQWIGKSCPPWSDRQG